MPPLCLRRASSLQRANLSMTSSTNRHCCNRPWIDRTRNRPLVVLWDETHHDGNRIAWPPDELFKLTCHPNVVLFHLHSVGDCSFRLHELWRKFRGVGWFVVPAGCQGTSGYGLGSPPIFTRTLHFLGLYQRGKVPAPAIVPGQIVDGGFPGVIRLVEAMWPKRWRVRISAREKAPLGGKLYTRTLPRMENYENPVLSCVVNVARD